MEKYTDISVILLAFLAILNDMGFAAVDGVMPGKILLFPVPYHSYHSLSFKVRLRQVLARSTRLDIKTVKFVN